MSDPSILGIIQNTIVLLWVLLSVFQDIFRSKKDSKKNHDSYEVPTHNESLFENILFIDDDGGIHHGLEYLNDSEDEM